MSQHPKPLRRQAFTMLELLVVITIIAILVAIAVIGIGRIMGGQQRTLTKTTLGTVQGMLTEFDRQNRLSRQPPHMWLPDNTLSTAPTPPLVFDIWRDADPRTAASSLGFQGIVLQGSVDADLNDTMQDTAPFSPRFHSPVIRNTQLVMSTLVNSGQAARKMVGQLPSGATMKLPGDRTETPGYDETKEPVVLDAWGNPIIFVPAAGLRDVVVGERPNQVITSVGVFNGTGTGPRDLPLTSTPPPQLPPNARPFFASAGPDGIFTWLDADKDGAYDPTKGDVAGGDDNLYSFEN